MLRRLDSLFVPSTDSSSCPGSRGCEGKLEQVADGCTTALAVARLSLMSCRVDGVDTIFFLTLMGRQAHVLVASAVCRDKSTDGAPHHHFEGV